MFILLLFIPFLSHFRLSFSFSPSLSAIPTRSVLHVRGRIPQYYINLQKKILGGKIPGLPLLTWKQFFFSFYFFFFVGAGGGGGGGILVYATLIEHYCLQKFA